MKLSHYEWNPEDDVIGEGGFAEVFKARDLNTANRFVALKIYKEAVSRGTTGNTGKRKYSLEREFAKVDGLSHTNIISYYGLDYLEHKDAMGRSVSYPVLIMEYAGDGTLKDLIKKGVSAKASENIIRSITGAMQYLHGQGIVHRDLKPGNILLSKDKLGNRVIKITDFGISQDMLSDKTLQETLTEGVGTPHYMAPEQFAKKKYGFNGEVSEHSDIWAIGVIFYHMLMGKRPFGEGTKDYELIRGEILEKEPDLTEIPDKFQTVIKTCLAKRADQRYPSIAALNEALNEDNNEGTVFLGDDTSGKETGLRPKRRLWPIVLALSAILLGTGTLGYTFYRSSKVKTLLDEAWDAYKVGDHKNAYAQYLRASEYHSGEAYYFLSTLNQYGYGTDRSHDKAREYADLAVDAGYDMGNFQLGWAHQNGLGVERDTTKAKTYFKKALVHIEDLSSEGHAEAQNVQGIMYRQGLAVNRDLKKSKQLYIKAADNQHPAAIENLAYVNRAEKNYKEAFELYKKCMEINRYSCHKGMADMYRYGYHVPKDTIKALELYRTAAENDYPNAQYLMGNFHFKGILAPKDKISAVSWYTKAAENGYLDAQNDLGVMYYREQNFAEAKKWFVRAAESGNAFAIHNLGIIAYYGKGEPADRQKARQHFLKAAEKGYAKSQYLVGTMFELGEGGEKNLGEAKKRYLLAAEQNDMQAQYALGRWAYNGIGGAQSYSSAREWYKKSADQKYASAQYMMGLMEEKGYGGPVNTSEAKRWYLLAANQNQVLAQRALGNMYYDGLLGSNKKYTALSWYVKAANQNDVRSQYMAGLINYKDKYYNLAKKWFQKAAEQNDGESQNYLGIIHELGYAGQKDIYAAFSYYNKAADNGTAAAMHNIGLCYYFGKGRAINKTKAKGWFRKACDGNHNNSCTFLSNNY